MVVVMRVLNTIAIKSKEKKSGVGRGARHESFWARIAQKKPRITKRDKNKE